MSSTASSQDTSCGQTCCDMAGLDCCMGDDFKKHPLPEIVQNDKRHCTDIPCLLVLIFALAAQVTLIVYANKHGADVNWLIHGYDYTGALCDSSNSNGSLNAWPDYVNYFSVRICVHNCSQTQKDDRMFIKYESTEFLSAWCVPKDTSSFQLFHEDEQLRHGVSDIGIAKWLILISAFIAIVLAFIYLRLIMYVGILLIWLTVIGVLAGGGMLSFVLIDSGILKYRDHAQTTAGKWEIVVGAGILSILFCLILGLLWMRKRIVLALHMLDEAGKAIRDMPLTVLFPILYSSIIILYIAFWIAITLYIYSVKQKQKNTMPTVLVDVLQSSIYYYYNFDESIARALAANCIILIYFMEFLIYFGYMVLAGVFGDWYFSEWDLRNKSKVRGKGVAQLSYFPILEALWRVLRYHLGTVAFGALLVSIIRIIRAIVKYIQYETESKAKTSNIVKCIFCCANCTLKCCECLFDRIAKEGFIFSIIYGTAFCNSSLQAVKLIWNNIARTTMVEGISKYMEFFGRMSIAALTTGICVIIMRAHQYYQDHLSSVIFPCVIIFVLSYLISTIFMMIFEVAIDTIFLCFLVDEATNNPPKFASDNLINLGSYHNTMVTTDVKEV